MTDENTDFEPLAGDADRRPDRTGVLVVAAGGMVGTAARRVVGEALPDVDGVPLGVVVVNVTGAFLIGALVATLMGWGAAPRRIHDVRLLLGTGLLGGYTTYSAFALGAAELIRDGRLATALVYGFGTVAAGVAATIAGMRAVTIVGGRR